MTDVTTVNFDGRLVRPANCFLDGNYWVLIDWSEHNFILFALVLRVCVSYLTYSLSVSSKSLSRLKLLFSRTGGAITLLGAFVVSCAGAYPVYDSRESDSST